MPFDASRKPVLVIGSGVTGQRAALDMAHAGLEVLLLERGASLGGTVAQLGTMFPLHNCLLCRGEAYHGPGCTRPTISPDLLDHARPANLAVWTQSQVTALAGTPGDWQVTVQRAPRHVQTERCINCDRCAQVCPQALPDPFQAGLAQRKAAYKPASRAVPDAYAIEMGAYCEGCGRCAQVCPTQAIDLTAPPLTIPVAASAIVLATGMQLYDASLSQEYGYGRYANVFTGLEMERMTSPAGPGEGRILRRSDGQPPRRIAWLQCIGSRDQTHDYCSAFCCGYATRQAVLARQLLPDAEAHIYLMDDRVFSKSFSTTYDPLRASFGIGLNRSRVSVLREDPTTHDLLMQVTAEDGRVTEERFSLVVLSVGAEAAAGAKELARTLRLESDDFGFIRTTTLAPVDTSQPGIFAAGTATGPADIADSVIQGAAVAARVGAFLGHVSAPEPPALHSAPQAADRRIGIFVCDCAGEIGGIVRLPETLHYAASLPGVVTCQVVSYGCLPEGLETISQTIQAQGLTDVVIGACNRRTFGPLFQQLPARVRFVSLREECAFVHRADPTGATRKAQELLRVAVEHLRHAAAPLSPDIEPVRAALVVGGGLAGLTSALHLADDGVPVHLVERAAHLGGNALRLGLTREGEALPAAVSALIARAQSHPQITLHTGAEVVRRGGRLGQFTATVRAQDGRSEEIQFGTAIVATGGQEYRGPAYGLGASDSVLTLLDLGQRLAAEPDLPAKLNQVVLISCVGPWNEPDSDRAWRCSRVCCEGLVRHARTLKGANPACQVIVLNREVNTYAFREEDYTAARRAGVLFVRFDPAHPPTVTQTADGLQVTVQDLTLHETLELHPGLLALGAAILPRADADQVAVQLDVPQLGEGFWREWEVKTQSYASLEPGIYLCGLGQGPKTTRETISQALAAANRAATLLAQPRIPLSATVAQVDQKQCAGCLTCVRVCPYSVPRIDRRSVGQGQRGRAYIDPARCQGCGTCASDCPVQAISIAGHDNEQITGGGALGRWLVV